LLPSSIGAIPTALAGGGGGVEARNAIVDELAIDITERAPLLAGPRDPDNPGDVAPEETSDVASTVGGAGTVWLALPSRGASVTSGARAGTAMERAPSSCKAATCKVATAGIAPASSGWVDVEGLLVSGLPAVAMVALATPGRCAEPFDAEIAPRPPEDAATTVPPSAQADARAPVVSPSVQGGGLLRPWGLLLGTPSKSSGEVAGEVSGKRSVEEAALAGGGVLDAAAGEAGEAAAGVAVAVAVAVAAVSAGELS